MGTGVTFAFVCQLTGAGLPLRSPRGHKPLSARIERSEHVAMVPPDGLTHVCIAVVQHLYDTNHLRLGDLYSSLAGVKELGRAERHHIEGHSSFLYWC
jgi:hypothetical protein